MSEASHDLLPHVLDAIHAVSSDTVRWFDQGVSKFEAKWSRFEREYLRRPTKVKPRGADHRPEWDRKAEKVRDNEAQIEQLKASFSEWGWFVEFDGKMIIPKSVWGKDVGKLKQIIREVRNLQKPENSWVLSTNESHHFKSMKEALEHLLLDREAFEQIDQIFEEEIPRHNRLERGKKIQAARQVIDRYVTLKRNSLLPDVTEEDIGLCVQDANPKALEEEFPLPWTPHVTGILHHTGHMLWAVSVELIFQMTEDRVRRLLFSGDIGSWNKPTIHGMPRLPNNTIDRLFMESTYANREHIDPEIEIQKIVEFIRTHKWPIIMPVFALDRLFVVLHALQDVIMRWEIDCPIFVRNRLGEKTLPIYTNYYPELSWVLSYVDILSEQSWWKEAYELVNSDKHCIILASGGTLIESSSAHWLLQSRAETGKEIFMIFTGYQPGELGAEIMYFIQDPSAEQKKTMRIGAHEAEIDKDDILCTSGFSWHGDHNDLVRFSHVWSVVSLIHGNPKTAPILAREIGADILPREVYTQIF